MLGHLPLSASLGRFETTLRALGAFGTAWPPRGPGQAVGDCSPSKEGPAGSLSGDEQCARLAPGSCCGWRGGDQSSGEPGLGCAGRLELSPTSHRLSYNCPCPQFPSQEQSPGPRGARMARGSEQAPARAHWRGLCGFICPLYSSWPRSLSFLPSGEWDTSWSQPPCPLPHPWPAPSKEAGDRGGLNCTGDRPLVATRISDAAVGLRKGPGEQS